MPARFGSDWGYSSGAGSLLFGCIRSADQIEFVNMIIDHLTARGTIEPTLLYESPLTDLNPLGVEGTLGREGVAKVIAILSDIHQWAVA